MVDEVGHESGKAPVVTAIPKQVPHWHRPVAEAVHEKRLKYPLRNQCNQRQKEANKSLSGEAAYLDVVE